MQTPSEDFGPEAAPHVLIIPGFSSPGIEWRLSPWRQIFESAGFTTEVWKHLDKGRGDINKQAEAVGDRVLEVSLEGPVFLLGHSMGGLIAKESQFYGMPSAIATVSAPHEGVNGARFAPWIAARQMDRCSHFTKQVASFPSLVPMKCFAGRYDLIVHPRSSQIHPYADEIEWVNHSHLSIIFSKDVGQRVINFFKSLTRSEEIQ